MRFRNRLDGEMSLSRLTNLIAETKAKDPALGLELEREFETFASRRQFGLNFERHRPESVELPGIDPHGPQYADALPKLMGLARYADAHKTVYRRIESVAEVGGRLRSLSITDPKVRAAIFNAATAEELFNGEVSKVYA